MDNLIDSRYFHGLIELPNLNIQAEFESPSGDEVTTNSNAIDMAITEHQQELLIKLFGSEVVPTQVESIIVREPILKSPIADYVFCKLIHEYQSQSTISGEKVHGATDSVSVSYQEKYFVVWNRLVKSCIQMRKVLYDAGIHSTYPTLDDEDIYEYKSFLL